MALCRCGKSENKPFCDGAHTKIGFSGKKDKDRVPDKVKDYKGEKLTVHYNRGICAHAESCVNGSSSVFRVDKRPWIDPDAADPEEIEKIIRACPSGALSYSKNGIPYKDHPRPPEITICKDSVYKVVGNIELEDPDGSVPELKDDAHPGRVAPNGRGSFSAIHYITSCRTLCSSVVYSQILESIY